MPLVFARHATSKICASGILVVLAGLTAGCADQHQTGQAMAAAGIMTAVVGASMASGNCQVEGTPGERYREPPSCSEPSETDEVVGTALMVAGAGLAIAGTAVQADASRGPDGQSQFTLVDTETRELETADNYLALGESAEQRGDWSGALDMYERAFVIEERALGPFHDRVRKTRQRMTRICGDAPRVPICGENWWR